MFQTDETLCSMLMNHVVSSACTFCSVLMEQACVLYEMRFVALGFFACVGENVGISVFGRKSLHKIQKYDIICYGGQWDFGNQEYWNLASTALGSLKDFLRTHIGILIASECHRLHAWQEQKGLFVAPLGSI